jgi:hypothetical protein
MRTALFIVMQLLFGSISMANGNMISVEKVYQGRKKGVQENAKVEKATIIDLIKSDAGLRSFYNKEMSETYDFLPANQIPKAFELSAGDISPWKVSSHFRFGQGDYQFCDMNLEEASYSQALYLVGFNTSYKREESYYLWALVEVNWDWCSNLDDLNDTTKERLKVVFKKWVDTNQVSALLFQ